MKARNNADCHLLWMSDGTGRPPSHCHLASSTGSTSPHVSDLPWLSVHSKHKLFVLFQVLLLILWPPDTHRTSQDYNKVGKGREIQPCRMSDPGFTSQQQRCSDELFGEHEVGSVSGNTLSLGSAEVLPLVISWAKPWLVHQGGLWQRNS